MVPVGIAVNKMAASVSRGIQVYIGPSRQLCSCCQRKARYPGWNPLQLCQDCFERIPWITDIQCPVCGRGVSCPDCLRERDEPRSLIMNRSAVRYDEGMKEWLARYKYRGDEKLQQLLGRMLVHAYRLYLEGVAGLFDCIAYVPVSEERYEERGFNQAEQMAMVLAGQVGLPVVTLLTRQRHTEKQSFKSRQERAANMTGAFAMIPGRGAKLQRRLKRQNPRILLIDDVYTTGSTLNQCAGEIVAGLPLAQVFGLCWAR